MCVNRWVMVVLEEKMKNVHISIRVLFIRLSRI